MKPQREMKINETGWISVEGFGGKDFPGMLSNEIIKSRFICDRGNAALIRSLRCLHLSISFESIESNFPKSVDTLESFHYATNVSTFINKPIHSNWHFLIATSLPHKQQHKHCNFHLRSNNILRFSLPLCLHSLTRAHTTLKALNYIFLHQQSVSTFGVNIFRNGNFAVFTRLTRSCKLSCTANFGDIVKNVGFFSMNI